MKKLYLLVPFFLFFNMSFLFCQEIQPVPTPITPSGKSLSPLEQTLREPQLIKMQPTYWMHDSTWYSQWLKSSSSWLLNEREFLSYNGSGFLTNDLYLVMNNSQQWENYNRYFSTFGTTGNNISYTGQTWNNSSNTWVDFMYSHYDATGRVDTSWYKQFDHVSNQFLNGSMNLYTYNASNQMTEMMGLNLDVVSGNWINNFRIVFSYNSGNLQTEELTLVWSASQSIWVNNQKYEFYYDSGNNPTGYLYSTWNTGSNLWEQNTKATYTNSTAGLPLVKLFQHWQTGTSSWQNFEQTTNQYNSYNQLTNDLDQLWNNGTASWVNNWKDQLVYYANNVQKTRDQFYWSTNGSIWMESYYTLNDSTGYMLEYYMKAIDFQNSTYTFGDRYLYFYNLQHNYTEYDHLALDIPSGNWVTSGRRQYSYNQDGNNTVQLDQVWDSLSNNYVNYYKIENFFSFTTNVWEKKDLSGYSFYPNPIRKGLPVNCTGLKTGEKYTIQLYSMNGQLIFSMPIHTGEDFFIPGNIAPGGYILTISIENRLITTGKVVVNE